MPIRYLLDTNTASYVIKGNVPGVRERLVKIPLGEVGISVITEAELRFGVERQPEATRLREAIEQFLLRLVILPWDSQAAQEYARIRAFLEKQGEPIGNMDLMIASQAFAAKIVLVSSDGVFRGVRGLKLEDWRRSQG
jgi:tRNA(fMet)-specific endonuclease VapC